MDKAMEEALVALAYKLIALATGGTPADAGAAMPVIVGKAVEPVSVYPREEEVNGVRYLLKAALNPKYAGGMYATVFGKGHVLFDPSNAPEGYPLRSPALYPLVYPLGGDGVPVGEAKVLFAGNTFADDAAVEYYIERTTRSPAEEARIQAEWAAIEQQKAAAAEALRQAQAAQEASSRRNAEAEATPVPVDGATIDLGG